ncbi:DNA-3-methyladenine glycosylase [Anseongella ginsenosidimutans]|uniref:Putative 3-methyladenine DNA glycosylase n=1 Tax=Anseongella ginsenosidimutans TaxID=496056 RepID=A0A4V2UTV2_9SPHI|nr:DNA-3-methyladenine glycosylase [Anseongella ginsenosidimutans]QEC53199.1 DNA-3-methyladenine glycosylase [Anseongella ginsenosidimutans]TCS87828.1 DNA-3-methyladenine glycosylase [Anseongella ginsenosidimutans]
MRLPEEFYRRDDVLQVSRDLLGKYLFTKINGKTTVGMIVETEAYRGPEDKASHAWNGRFTNRTRVMYEPGGIAYIYLCYGIHYLFNVVTATEGIPHAVLVRAVEPVEGIAEQLERRKMTQLHPRITAGPGALCMALGITRDMNGKSLQSESIWIEERGTVIESKDIIAGPRVGVAYAGEHALLPWRFSVRNNKFVSKAK